MIDLERQIHGWLIGEELEGEHWGGYAFWYEGPPSYSEFPTWSDEYEYRTALAYELWGPSKAPEGWERVASYSHSGEGPCPYQGCDLGEDVAACAICEEDTPDGWHPDEGWIYIGDGWCEVVYRRPRED